MSDLNVFNKCDAKHSGSSANQPHIMQSTEVKAFKDVTDLIPVKKIILQHYIS